jgi:hypothetical protein
VVAPVVASPDSIRAAVFPAVDSAEAAVTRGESYLAWVRFSSSSFSIFSVTSFKAFSILP